MSRSNGTGGPIVELENLTKVFNTKKGEVRAVDGVSLQIGRNEIVGLLGVNGAGKTTTIKMMCTLIEPTSGTVRVDGLDVRTHRRAALRKIAAVLEGNRNIYWRLTPRENLEFFAGMQGLKIRAIRPYIEQLMSMFHLEDKADTPARMLSRGMQQKLAVMCSLVKKTDVLLLDEPTLGLDVKTSYELRGYLRQMAASGERTVLVSSHDMNVVEAVCDRVVIIHQGRVVVNEKVSSLLQLFQSKAVRCTFDLSLDHAQESTLRSRFDVVSVAATADEGGQIDVNLQDGKQVYDLIDALRGQGMAIRSLERRSPDLEEVFLSYVQGA